MIERLQRARKGDESGFTLVELLVVIAILGILSAVVVFAVGGIDDKGQDSACEIDTRTIRTAEEAFFAQPSSGNKYAAESALVPNFLSKESTLHNVRLTPDDTTATGYVITIESDKCGAAGADVNGTTNK